MEKKVMLMLTVMLLTVFSATAQKKMDKFMVQVDGLGCPFCAYGLEKKFKEFKGIKNVKINIETGDFNFDYPSEKSLTLQAVEKQVEKAGYTPITAKVERADGKVETTNDTAVTIGDTSQLVTEEVFVAGNCGQCRARIEKAAKDVKGVGTAIWDKETKIMKVAFNPAETSLEVIGKSIAKAGHDTKNHQAEVDNYGNLPACCKYERIEY